MIRGWWGESAEPGSKVEKTDKKRWDRALTLFSSKSHCFAVSERGVSEKSVVVVYDGESCRLSKSQVKVRFESEQHLNIKIKNMEDEMVFSSHNAAASGEDVDTVWSQ